MNPTNKLRFVEREQKQWVDDRTYNVRTIRVLQQWWEDNRHDIHWVDGAPGEWRDVPLEVET
jgi:hypothetical protein